MAFPRGQIAAHPDQGRVIRTARLKRGITLTKLAELLSDWFWLQGIRRHPVSRRYVVRLQAGQRCPSGQVAAGLGHVLGVALPMPPIDPMRTAAGRKAQKDRVRARQKELERQRSIPRLETYHPADLYPWS